ncbi:hypothetical protein GCM10012279_46300 [Micromonospora yangpuensis]|nr:hypothetical protein GCM10012279_46300 [Micromonospora yangpuensis]
MVEQLGGGPALLAETAQVGRELPGEDLDALPALTQRHRALEGAVRAVRGGVAGRGSRWCRRACTVCHVRKACRWAVSGPGLPCFGPVKSGSHRTWETGRFAWFTMWENRLI